MAIKNIETQNAYQLRNWKAVLERFYLKLMMSRFKWTGLAPLMDNGSCSGRYPEYWLATAGSCCLTSFPEIDDGCIPFPVATTSVTFDPFGCPSTWQAYALGNAAAIVNGKQLDNTTSAWIWDSGLQVAPMQQIDFLIDQIVRADAAARNNVGVIGHSVVIKTNMLKAVSDSITAKQWENFEPLIVDTGSNPTETTEVLMSDVPFHGIELQDYIARIDSRIRLMIGLDSKHESQTHIAERAYMGDDELICWIRESSLETRQRACEHFNEIYGTNVKVEWRQPSEELLNPLMQSAAFGGDGAEEPGNVDGRSM